MAQKRTHRPFHLLQLALIPHSSADTIPQANSEPPITTITFISNTATDQLQTRNLRVLLAEMLRRRGPESMHLVTLDVKGMTVMPSSREAMGREARGTTNE